MMRGTLERNAARYDKMLRAYLVRDFRAVEGYRDDIVSDSFYEVVSHLEAIGESRDEVIKRGSQVSKEAWLYACLRNSARFRAIAFLNSPRLRRTRSLEDERELSDGTYHTPPKVVSWPEQEDIVFRKQLLEHCASLPDDERVVMEMSFDRATLEEMIAETGIPRGELLDRRRRAMFRLMEKANGIGERGGQHD